MSRHHKRQTHDSPILLPDTRIILSYRSLWHVNVCNSFALPCQDLEAIFCQFVFCGQCTEYVVLYQMRCMHPRAWWCLCVSINNQKTLQVHHVIRKVKMIYWLCKHYVSTLKKDSLKPSPIGSCIFYQSVPLCVPHSHQPKSSELLLMKVTPAIGHFSSTIHYIYDTLHLW